MSLPEPRTFAELEAVEPHGIDAWVGSSPPYAWGRIYGGQVVAQALRAAMHTVEESRVVHSLHAYFILGGRLDEPVRYEVDRVRTGASFVTRRVVARQSTGAILTLEASFQAAEDAPAVQTVRMPADVPGPEQFPEVGWGWIIERRQVPQPHGTGRALTWVRVDRTVGPDARSRACALAFASDTATVMAVRAAHPAGDVPQARSNEVFMAASLDHAVWFHADAPVDDWLLIDMHCHAVGGARGLSIGHVFAPDGLHVATIVQEALVRERRSDPVAPRDVSGT